ncbi:unnamed protein product [Meloidogyne enterolobii]|uniref:Uncharacterized protein n=1 Tax=Meloidogyne enterolobii TaxID=390850 RepID=A0ACB1AVR4_MELEN
MCENQNEAETSKADLCTSINDSNTVNNQTKNRGEEINKNKRTIKAEMSKGSSRDQKGKLAKNILMKGKPRVGKYKSKDRSYLAIKKALAEVRKRKEGRKEH